MTFQRFVDPKIDEKIERIKKIADEIYSKIFYSTLGLEPPIEFRQPILSNNLFLSGSMIQQMYNNYYWKDSDIDIYCAKEAFGALKALVKKYYEGKPQEEVYSRPNVTKAQQNVLTIYCNFDIVVAGYTLGAKKVQFIEMIKDNIVDEVKTFDIHHLMSYYNFSERKLYLNDFAHYCLVKNWVVPYSEDAKDEGINKRIEKYQYRLMPLWNPDLAKNSFKQAKQQYENSLLPVDTNIDDLITMITNNSSRYRKND